MAMSNKFVHLSDLHIGHPKINSETLIYNLEKYVYPELEDCDGIFLGGDIFHSSISLDNSAAMCATTFIQDLYNLSRKYNFFIRVLRGTWSHDKNQLELFNALQKYKKIDMKYFDTVSIEYIKKVDLYVLYIPDNLPFRNIPELMDHIKDLMRQIGITKINLVIGHGYFNHALPLAMKHLQDTTLSYKHFSSIVNGPIVMGHVHTPSSYKNIHYIGSFERHNHGEEEAKGFLISKYDNKKWSLKFVENKDTVKFITLHIDKYLTLDSTTIFDEITLLPFTEIIEKRFNGDTSFGFLRIVVKDDNLRFKVLLSIKKLYPHLTVTTSKPKDINNDSNQIDDNDLLIQETQLKAIPSKDSLPAVIHEFSLYKLKKDIPLSSIQEAVKVLYGS